MDDPNTLKALGLLQSESLEALRQFNGVLWKEVFGEFHAGYAEMPIWVLLYKNSDLHKCHAVAAETLIPYFDRIAPAQFTLSYTIATPDHQITVDTFMDHEEITQALGAATLGAAPDVSARSKEGLFAGLISGPAPQ